MIKNNVDTFTANQNIHPSFDATSYPQERVIWSGKKQHESQKVNFFSLKSGMKRMRKLYFRAYVFQDFFQKEPFALLR